MGWFSRRKTEERAQGLVEVEDTLLRAMLGSSAVTKEMALQVPTISGGIDQIAGVIAGTPIKLYRETDGKAEEVTGDPRIRLLNDETGDTLDANQFWRAMVRDYYTGKGGYAYIHRRKGKFVSLHYVDEAQVAVVKNADPIFKDYTIQVGGAQYWPFEFLKILRNTTDGITGHPITTENSKLIETAYQSLCFECYLARKGGNKKGFLKSAKPLSKEAMDALKEAYAKLYSNGSDNVVVLNNGIEFQESSATSVEMQLNETKITNASEFAKIFHVSVDAMAGKEHDVSGLAKLAAIPLMGVIQCALNRDFLLEKEKGNLYWAFDTKELLKGTMRDRFEAYKTALEANFMQIDEVRFMEDMDPLGLKWIRLGLNDVLYDPSTGQIYTPNTNKTAGMGPKALPSPEPDDTMEPEDSEERARWIKKPDGKFNGSVSEGGGTKKTKYAPSPQVNTSKVKVGPKSYARLCGAFRTKYPQATPEDGVLRFTFGGYQYEAVAAENGGISIENRFKLKSRR